MKVALSTIGMACYNALTVRGPLMLEQILDFNTGVEFPIAPPAAVKALDELVARGRVVQDGPIYRARGPAGALVRNRDRRGDGWDGWLADVPNRGRVPLDQVLS